MKRFVLLALFVLIPCSAKAQVSIPVTNADFETYSLPAGGGFAAPFFEIDPADPLATSAPLIARLNSDGELVSGANNTAAEAPLGWEIVMDEPLAPYVNLQNLVAAPILSPVSSYQPGEADGQVGGIYLEVENENVPVGRVGLQQTLAATLQPNRSYTLSVDVGNIQSASNFNFDGFPGYEVVVRAGGEVMTSDIRHGREPHSRRRNVRNLRYPIRHR